MAIYRTGQASMDANGYITGYGTKWKTALTLIRPGATIVFASNPVAYATISEIVNDTSLRATSTGGAVVPRGDYVILMHDSITVDGLAQDVAETLRYYQGQETMYQEFVEFLKGFDWQKLEELERNAEANAAAADASAKAAAQSETNANASKNAAAASATTASQQASAAASSASAAKASENSAASSKTAAANSASSAATSATTAGQHKDAAAASASDAKTSETNASASKTAAASSASAAKTSETNAKASETNAASSASAANTAKNEAQTAASSANASKSAAASSATAAAGSATTAKNEADRAASLASQLDATNLMRKDANLSDVVNKATARDNLELGTGNTVTFSQVRAPSGMICTTESNSANDNPSAALVTQIMASDKSTILGRAEFRADRNGALSIINRAVPSSPKFFTILSTGEVNPPGEIVSNLGATFSSMEVGQRNANTSAYIDFHYGAKYDYDARIVCDGMNSDRVGGGNLRFNAGYLEMNTISRPTVREYGLAVIGNGASVIMQPKDDAQPCYLLGRDYQGNNQWYIGRGGSDANVNFHSYQYGTNLQVRSDDVYVNKNLTSQGDMVCNGSSIYVDGGSGSGNTHLWLRNSSKKTRAVIYSNDSQVLNLRSDNAGTGASGKTMSWDGSTGALTVVSLTQTSDERAKFWIKPVTNALDKICELNGVTFSMHTTIQNTVRNAGVIAQDVQKVLPEAVTEHKTNKNAPVIDKNCQQVENPLSVDYNALSALYVEAFKEMRGLIEAQRAEIEALKAEIMVIKNNAVVLS